eukprot:TRINITY_DN2685_c0_g1_i1.p1 TRINITY_DN2685_c0_g1~~TRINITY_DN2685_c0_g1_i1.p1  ORF type:complete len:345 (-),score=65.00 TRINITY_DN2685_c0_g1_i1:408-1352(-)
MNQANWDALLADLEAKHGLVLSRGLTPQEEAELCYFFGTGAADRGVLGAHLAHGAPVAAAAGTPPPPPGGGRELALLPTPPSSRRALRAAWQARQQQQRRRRERLAAFDRQAADRLVAAAVEAGQAGAATWPRRRCWVVDLEGPAPRIVRVTAVARVERLMGSGVSRSDQSTQEHGAVWAGCACKCHYRPASATAAPLWPPPPGVPPRPSCCPSAGLLAPAPAPPRPCQCQRHHRRVDAPDVWRGRLSVAVVTAVGEGGGAAAAGRTVPAATVATVSTTNVAAASTCGRGGGAIRLGGVARECQGGRRGGGDGR